MACSAIYYGCIIKVLSIPFCHSLQYNYNDFNKNLIFPTTYTVVQETIIESLSTYSFTHQQFHCWSTPKLAYVGMYISSLSHCAVLALSIVFAQTMNNSSIIIYKFVKIM